MADLIRHALDVNLAMLAMGSDRVEAEGARFARNRALPAVWDGNHVSHVTASTPDEIDRLQARVDVEFADVSYRRYEIDRDTPPQFEARLACDGYRPQSLVVMLLEGDPRGRAKSHDVRLIEDGEGWQAYEALCEIDWHDYASTLGQPGDVWTADDMFQARRIKSPPARFWLAYDGGRPVAFLHSWEGTDGVGIVDDLFTHADFRRRGHATALLLRGIADCRSRGAGPVVIVADPTDTPKDIYESMGFRPVALKRTYHKVVRERVAAGL